MLTLLRVQNWGEFRSGFGPSLSSVNSQVLRYGERTANGTAAGHNDCWAWVSNAQKEIMREKMDTKLGAIVMKRAKSNGWFYVGTV